MGEINNRPTRGGRMRLSRCAGQLTDAADGERQPIFLHGFPPNKTSSPGSVAKLTRKRSSPFWSDHRATTARLQGGWNVQDTVWPDLPASV